MIASRAMYVCVCMQLVSIAPTVAFHAHAHNIVSIIVDQLCTYSQLGRWSISLVANNIIILFLTPFQRVYLESRLGHALILLAILYRVSSYNSYDILLSIQTAGLYYVHANRTHDIRTYIRMYILRTYTCTYTIQQRTYAGYT